MKNMRFKVTLDVEIDPQGVSARSVQNNLFHAMRFVLDEGLLTNESLATVESYDFSVERVADSSEHLFSPHTDACVKCGADATDELLAPTNCLKVS